MLPTPGSSIAPRPAGHPPVPRRWLAALVFSALVSATAAAEDAPADAATPAPAAEEAAPTPAEDGPPMVRRSEVTWRVLEDVRFPRAAKGLGLGEVTCSATLRVDTSGRPTAVQIEGCPKPFRTATALGLSQWRAEPLVIDGTASPFRTIIVVRFREV